MEKLKKLTKEIQKQIPEIVELKLGCKVMVGKLEHIIYEVEENYYSACMIFQGEWVDIEVGKDRKKDIKLLGRDITFEDVLRVANMTFVRVGDGSLMIDDNTIELLHAWQLGKPLHQQKPETINFLYELICENNG